VTWSPLGEYEPFRSWTTRDRRWGDGGRSRVWFGSSVIDGLASVIDEHLAAPRPGKTSDTLPAAIGCVPWLTHPGIAARLARLGSCCVVVDKGGRAGVPRVLRDAGNWFPNVLPGLRDRLPGGAQAILGPYSPEPVFMVGPVRVVGMSGGDNRKPLLHAKLLVLGWEMYGEGEFGEEHHWFKPSSAWWGSANWTTQARPTWRWGRGPTTRPWRARRRTSSTR
jgi:hypothetical protein